MSFGFNLPFGKKKDDDILKELEDLDKDKNDGSASLSSSFSNLNLQPPESLSTNNFPSPSSTSTTPFSSAVSNTPSGFMTKGQTPTGFSGYAPQQTQYSQQGQSSHDLIQQRINQILDQIQGQNIKYEQLKVEFGTISINLEIIKRQLEQIKLKIDNQQIK
ncbi:MAG: hypothetical protein COW47_00445 [Candidatus Huberarchaeum crystalense]|uniref:Uncharacterized protein n=1 Tax=Huberarchaeum crystalense TaxID=2014257 RepID=A0A2G9LJ14_HUBC1|nr:hypothetical protein [archaeon]OIP20413.1 MAG: hypothetical protein AUJ91_01310 [archaeon CG2_30_31_98]PIN66536.1 MAG: hypothetical protein COW69_01740 [Candidatus Huberarchaeum crystalense]NCS98490.1 hypothetical protein [archaeon]PIV13582.1 MAG: hypothetical protein COS45_02180 [Candidatus Huberarchaeum crystalense]